MGAGFYKHGQCLSELNTGNKGGKNVSKPVARGHVK